jgi:hypothetical protein
MTRWGTQERTEEGGGIEAGSHRRIDGAAVIQHQRWSSGDSRSSSRPWQGSTTYAKGGRGNEKATDDGRRGQRTEEHGGDVPVVEVQGGRGQRATGKGPFYRCAHVRRVTGRLGHDSASVHTWVQSAATVAAAGAGMEATLKGFLSIRRW